MEITEAVQRVCERLHTETGRSKHGKSKLVPFLVLLFFSYPLLMTSPSAYGADGSAQGKPKLDYALIFGTVWDTNDRPAYGVPIKIRRADDKPKKVRWELMSDHSGEFAQRVPTGQADYIVWADIKTKKGQSQPESRVHIENDERVDISLHLPH
jgi:hypothetical protein